MILIIYSINNSKFVEQDVEEECNRCKHTSICAGGCKFNAFTSNKKKDCRRRFIDKSFPEIIKLLAKLEEVESGIYKVVR